MVSKNFTEVTAVEMAKVTSNGQITVPIDVRLRLGLTEGSRMLFIEQGDGFFVVNENRIDIDSISGAKVKTVDSKGWTEDYVKAIMAFGDTPDETFVEPTDIPWTEREILF